MSTPALMFQGTGSDVGKSLLVAGFCRALKNRGLRVAPFKPQNMSNNAAVTREGGEIGRAQALQARAAGVTPCVHMNPVLLKPQSDTGAQVVVHGQVITTSEAREYGGLQAQLLDAVLESFERIKQQADIVLVEGAGSPAEVNLRSRDIANMGFAIPAQVPVVLIGDIDRGGVIASMVGTHQLLTDQERALMRGFLINKFRGDVALFNGGLRVIEEQTQWRGFGVIPWLSAASRLPAEDGVALEDYPRASMKGLHIAVPMLSRIANFDDLDPLRLEPNVSVAMVPPGSPLPVNADLVIIPGTKSTLADLSFLRSQGWDIDILSHWRRGGQVLGICGGYQLLGHTIVDRDGVEGSPGTERGLGLLNVHTELETEKAVREVQARCTHTGCSVSGYEIHVGQTQGADCLRPVLMIGERSEGAASADGLVRGTYVHGLFSSDEYRCAFLSSLTGLAQARGQYEHAVETALDELAERLEDAVDVSALIAEAS